MRRKSMAACMTLALVAALAAAPTAAAAPAQSGADGSMTAAATTAVPGGQMASDVVVATPRSDDKLDHDAREAIHEVVTQRPGVHLARAASLADVDVSTARYHVRVLERANLVDSEHQLGKRRLYPAGHAEDRAADAAAADPTLGPVVRAVAGDAQATVPSVADTVNSAESTVSHHLGRLADVGVVDRERDGGTVTFSLAAGDGSTVESESSRTGTESSRLESGT